VPWNTAVSPGVRPTRGAGNPGHLGLLRLLGHAGEVLRDFQHRAGKRCAAWLHLHRLLLRTQVLLPPSAILPPRRRNTTVAVECGRRSWGTAPGLKCASMRPEHSPMPFPVKLRLQVYCTRSETSTDSGGEWGTAACDSAAKLKSATNIRRGSIGAPGEMTCIGAGQNRLPSLPLKLSKGRAGAFLRN